MTLNKHLPKAQKKMMNDETLQTSANSSFIIHHASFQANAEQPRYSANQTFAEGAKKNDEQ